MEKGYIAKLEAKTGDNKGIGILQVCYGKFRKNGIFIIAP